VHEFNQGIYDIIIATDQVNKNNMDLDSDDEEKQDEATPSTDKPKIQKSKKRKTKQDNEFGVARGTILF
jgi:hypothetical protein